MPFDVVFRSAEVVHRVDNVGTFCKSLELWVILDAFKVTKRAARHVPFCWLEILGAYGDSVATGKWRLTGGLVHCSLKDTMKVFDSVVSDSKYGIEVAAVTDVVNHGYVVALGKRLVDDATDA